MTDEAQQTEEAEDGEAQVTLKREQIRSMERDAKEARTLRKEIAFMKAGIDTEKGVGKLAFNSYDGDFTPEAITAFAEEYGITASSGTQTDTGNPNPSRYDASEEEQTGVRRLTTSGGTPDDGSEDPRSAAVKVGRQVRQERTQDDAIAAAVSVLATAAKNGDQRAIVREVNPR